MAMQQTDAAKLSWQIHFDKNKSKQDWRKINVLDTYSIKWGMSQEKHEIRFLTLNNILPAGQFSASRHSFLLYRYRQQQHQSTAFEA